MSAARDRHEKLRLSTRDTRYVLAVNRATNPTRALLDPGWLFLVAGMALLSSVAIIPAQQDLRDARWMRDRALSVEKHRQSRLDRYEEFLAALDEKDRTLVLALAAGQLNLIPTDKAPVPGTVRTTTDASVFPSLEPPPAKMPTHVVTQSTLGKWSRDNRARVWVIAAGCFMVLVGLLPPSKGWSGVGRTTKGEPEPVA